MFKIHLVLLVLGKFICMQKKSQKWTNDVHRRQFDHQHSTQIKVKQHHMCH